MTWRAAVGKSMPSIVTSPELEYVAAGWAYAALEFRIWRQTINNLTLVWAVVATNSEFRLRRVAWTPILDRETYEFRDLIDTTDVPIALVNVQAIALELSAISFPVFAPTKMGFDGESRGIERRGFPKNILLGWWCDAPATWTEISTWHAKTECIFEELLPELPESFNLGYRVKKGRRMR